MNEEMKKKTRHDLNQVKNWLEYIVLNLDNKESKLDLGFINQTLDASVEKISRLKTQISENKEITQ